MTIKRFIEGLGKVADRYEKNEDRREKRKEHRDKKAGDREWWQVDEQQRLVQRLNSKGLIDEAIQLEEWDDKVKPELGFDPLERILEDNELISSTALYQGAAQTHSVGRVVIRTASGRVAGYGTGFLVSPRLLLTNNHVLETASEAGRSTVQFFFWEDFTGRRGSVVEHELDPQRFFETDDPLDFTLVAVKERSAGYRLKDLGWTPFIAESGKASVGEPVNIIQHPGGEDQKVVLRQNEIIDVVDDFLHYEADTKRGSSGSPVYSVDWELAALHHSSVPKRNGNRRILLRDGSVWSGDPRRVDDIEWVANEGVRISSIVAKLRSEEDGWSAEKQQLFGQCFDPRPRFDEVLPGIGAAPEDGGSGSRTHGGAGGGGPERSRRSPRRSSGCDGAQLADALRRALCPPGGTQARDAGFGAFEAIDRDYTNRRGYRTTFLGSGRFRVPIPALRAGSNESDGVTLRYHRFSITMNPDRRLARIASSNLHGRLMHAIRRRDGQTSWIFDDRLDDDEQIGNDLYRYNPLDRGHLVRRLDAAWGNTRGEAMDGNDDTFHYTNSAPQHEDFNEDDDTWAGLEDHYLEHAGDADRKITVFTGPVFDEDDPEYTSPDGEVARIPRQYWKVIVYRAHGALAADGYLLSQEEVLDDMGLETFGGDDFATFRAPLADIATLTDLDFGGLVDGDTYDPDIHGDDGDGHEAIGAEATRARRRIRTRRVPGPEAIRVGRPPR